MIKVGKQNGEPLGEKRPVFVYQSFKDRFDAVCKALKVSSKMIIAPSLVLKDTRRLKRQCASIYLKTLTCFR